MPVAFTQEIFDTICEEIAKGKSLRSICKRDDMPSTSGVMKWLKNDEHGSLVEQYARARELQADYLADEILDIADNAANDWMEAHGSDDAAYRINGEHIQRSKLRIDSRKWLAGKLRPKVYGDKLDHVSTDGSMSPKPAIDATKLSDTAMEEILSAQNEGTDAS